MSHTIAIVEDDPDQSRNYQDALQRQGFKVQCWSSRREAETGIPQCGADLAILDIMLGEEMDGGFTLCRTLLARCPDLPIIFLTSRADEIDRISGLRLGAWDYQTKPVSLQFLVERIRSLLRIRDRQTQEPGMPLRDIGPLRIHEERYSAWWQDQPLSLTYTEFNLLLEMVNRMQERGASYDQLACATRQGVVENNTINTHIRHLRRKFRELDADFDCIQNVYGFGYRWSRA